MTANPQIYTVLFHISVYGGLKLSLGGISPKKLSQGDWTG